MKKKVLLVAAILTAGMTFAQEEFTSKKGVPILPESGDYGLGFDATNLLNYGGNLFNGNTGNSAAPLGDLNAATIYGKYFTASDQAYRGMVRLGFGTTTNRTVVDDVSPSADAGATVEDEAKTNNLNITVGGGIEYRRGKGRLQGVYGPMAMISLGSSKTENTYGNSLEDEFNDNGTAQRTLENKQGGTFGLSVGGFAGVEYFFAPKISVGGEIAWTIRLNTQGNGETTTETYDNISGETTETTTETGGSSTFSLDTRPMGNLSVNFYF